MRSSRDRHRRIGELFAAASKLPAARRTAYLEERCDDPELRAEVAALLDEDRVDSLETGDIRQMLGQAAAEVVGADPVAPSVGPYRIIRLIGRGGMGEVYEAEQEDPRRRVALKVVQRADME